MELNPLFEADSKLIFKTVAEKPENFNIETETNSKNMTLSTKHQLAVDDIVFPFKYEWRLKRANAEEFSKFITVPLLKSILVHQAEVTNLKQIIEKKDAEIEQYKLEGAVLIRKTVSTAPFDSNQFDAHYVCEVGNDAKTNFYTNKTAFELIKPMILQQDIKPYIANKSVSDVIVEAHQSSSPKLSPSSKKKQNVMLQRLKRLIPTERTKVKYDNDESDSSGPEEENSFSKRLRNCE